MKRPLIPLAALALVVSIAVLATSTTTSLAEDDASPLSAEAIPHDAIDAAETDTVPPVPADQAVPPTYWAEGFEDLEAWTEQHPDPTEQVSWRIAPAGQDGDPAALLADEQGLPRNVHAALASDAIDLTPVPSLPSEARPGVDAAESLDATRGTDEALATTHATVDLFTFTSEAATTSTGPVHVPEGPAYLSLLHRFAFDDARNEDGHAVTGFTIEAREAGGEWTTIEPAMLAQAARETEARTAVDDSGPEEVSPFAVTDATIGFDGESVDPCRPFDLAGAIATYVLGAGASNCTAEPFTVPSPSPAQPVDDPVLQLGDTLSLHPVGEAANTSYPAFPEAYIEPLEAHGYTGTSPDEDGDDRPDVVGWIFDLSPWAGRQVELRFRAGTNPVTPVEGGFWAIDEAQVRGAAHAADLRLELAHPDGDDLAAPGEPFPLTAEIENVGLAQQDGPFTVAFTVRSSDGDLVKRKTVETDGSLGFRDTTQATLDHVPTGEHGPLHVEARLQAGHPDNDPRNDEDRALLDVGVDRSLDLAVEPRTSRVTPGEPLTVDVTVTNEGNVPVQDALHVAPLAHDPTTETPGGPPLDAPAVEPIQLPRSAERHPDGVADASVTRTVTFTIDESRPVEIQAEIGEALESKGVGVGTPAPPVLSASFEKVDRGPASIDLSTEDGNWRAWADSDVAPMHRKLSPGDLDGGAWVPLEHDATLVRPHDGRHLVSGHQQVSDVTADEICAPQFLILTVLPPFCTQDPVERQPGTPLVLESPRGTQRVHAMTHDVDLTDASQAQASFVSAMLPPDDPRDVQEARVYVATEDDVASLGDQLAETCHRAEETVGDPASDVPADPATCPITSHVAADENADVLVASLFDLEESLRCELPQALDEVLDGSSAVVTSRTCPSAGGGDGADDCSENSDVGTQWKLCTAHEPSQLDALLPMLSGALVHRDTSPHPWQRTTIDLDAWAGENVKLGIVYVAESDEARHDRDLRPDGSTDRPLTLDTRGDGVEGFVTDPLSGTLGYGPPGRAQGAFLVDRVLVETDTGLALHPQDTERDASRVADAAQDHRPDEARDGWRTIGYEHRLGLDQPGLVPTHAQVTIGAGFSPDEDADDSDALAFGQRDGQRIGLELHPRRLHRDAVGAPEQEPARFQDNADDPAVTVLASPTIDLTGTEDPILRFRQHFDLTTPDGPQLVTDELDPAHAAEAMGLSRDATQHDRCAIGDRAEAGQRGANVTLEGLACLLAETRKRDDTFAVPTDVYDPRVRAPSVSAGLYVQARTVTDEGLSQPQLVTPVEGYRYPAADADGFEPTLGYTVDSPESHPGYTLGPDLLSTSSDNAATNQPTYEDPLASTHAGTPVWAGDSDVDGDGEADWVTSRLDLSAMDGERVRLEFVLVARHNHTVSNPSDPRDDGTLLTAEPWAIDELEIVERDDEGQVAIESLDWPDPEAAMAAPGDDLPVRVTLTTPTGLDRPVHARAQLVDAEGCRRAQATSHADPGALAPGEETELAMTLPGEDVEGPTPWRVVVDADVAQTPPTELATRIDTIVRPGDPVHGTEALLVQDGTDVRSTIVDPDCQPATDVVLVEPTEGQPLVETHPVGGDDLEIEIEDGAYTGDIATPVPDRPHALAVVEDQDGDGGAWARTLTTGNGTATVDVDPATDRVPTGTPTTLELSPRSDLTEARVWIVDPDQPQAPSLAWTGTLDALDTTTLTLTVDGTGPRLIVVTGRTANGALALGAAELVATDADEAGDPMTADDRLEETLLAASREDVDVDVQATPTQGLSTEPRTVTVPLQNTGTRTLTNVTVELRGDGDVLRTWTVNLTPGAQRTFTTEIETGPTPSLVLEALADAGNSSARATASTALRSLVKVDEPTFTDPGPGWSLDNGTATFADPQTGQAPRDTVGSVQLAANTSGGLNGLMARVDHTLAMEDAFDAGQAHLSVRGDQRLLPSDQDRELSPLSPLEGHGLTGTVDGHTRFRATADTTDATTQRLSKETAVDALGPPLIGDNASGYADCQGPTFTDGDTSTPVGDGCSWSDPLFSFPETVLSDGVWHLQPASFLSSENNWTVEDPASGAEYDITVNEATSYVFLEAGRDLVAAAQAEDRLHVAFEEARELEASFGPRAHLSVEVCARFMSVEDEDGEITLSDETPVVRRCSGLTHDDAEDQLLEKPWSQTDLTIGDIPETEAGQDDYNVVRLELSLEQDRRADRGTGIIGRDGQNERNAIGLQQPVKGWFVGPIAASAGTTERTWTPDAEALATTDPNTGANATRLDDRIDDHHHPGSLRLEKQIDQFSAVGLTDVEIIERHGDDEETYRTSTIRGMEETGTVSDPAFQLPLISCPWYEAGTCSWTEIVDTYLGSGWGAHQPDRVKALATAPYAMNLTCSQPGELPYVVDDTPASEDGDPATTSGCQTSEDLPGMGVQALNATTIHEGSTTRCGDETMGPPTLWRTRCLHVERATETGSHPDPAGSALLFTTKPADPDSPLRSQGHSVDARLVTTVDLRHVAADGEAWLTPTLRDPSPGGNRDLAESLRAQARIVGTEEWTDVPQCRDRVQEDCRRGWHAVGGIGSGDHLDLTAFAGHRIELAFRVQLSHPWVPFHGDGEPSVALADLRVDADVLPITEANLSLTAGTDISVEEEGWTVRDVELYGVPIEANVGVDEVRTDLRVADRVHVHADTRTDEDLFMALPATLALHNQGAREETVSLEAVLEGREDERGTWEASDTEAWLAELDAPGLCDVQVTRTDPNAELDHAVELAPGERTEVDVRVDFVPASAAQPLDPGDENATRDVLEECFPHQFEDPFKEGEVDHAFQFRLRLGLGDRPAGDIVTGDDEQTLRLRPNPFLDRPLDDGAHEPGILADALELTPTRPAGDEDVTADTTLRLVDRTPRGLDGDLQLVDPATGTVHTSLSLVDAEHPRTTLDPYETVDLRWNVTEIPDEAALARLEVSIVRDGETLTDTDDAWIAPGGIEDLVDRHTAEELTIAGDAERRETEDGTVIRAERQEEDGSPFATGGDVLEAAIGTDWIELDASPPPLVSVRADWRFEEIDRYAGAYTGWALQVCHVTEPRGGECPISTEASGESGSDRWAWRTVDVVQAPAATIDEIGQLDGARPPEDCQGTVVQTQPPGAGPCTGAAADWANLHAGEATVTGIPAGDGLRTVSADLTACSVRTVTDEPGCPAWSTTDRHDPFRVRIVAFSTQDAANATLTVESLTVTPVQAEGEQPAAVTVPAGTPKALPVEAHSLGAVGLTADATTDASTGVAADLERSTLTLDGADATRLVVDAEPGAPSPAVVETRLDPRPPNVPPTMQGTVVETR